LNHDYTEEDEKDEYIQTKTLLIKNIKKQSDKSLFELKPVLDQLKKTRSQAK